MLWTRGLKVAWLIEMSTCAQSFLVDWNGLPSSKLLGWLKWAPELKVAWLIEMSTCAQSERFGDFLLLLIAAKSWWKIDPPAVIHSVSMIRRVVNSPSPVIRWVADSLYRWVGELPTPHITDTESRRLRVSLSRGVDDSPYRWHGESLFEKKISLASIFSTLNR